MVHVTGSGTSADDLRLYFATVTTDGYLDAIQYNSTSDNSIFRKYREIPNYFILKSLALSDGGNQMVLSGIESGGSMISVLIYNEQNGVEFGSSLLEAAYFKQDLYGLVDYIVMSATGQYQWHILFAVKEPIDASGTYDSVAEKYCRNTLSSYYKVTDFSTYGPYVVFLRSPPSINSENSKLAFCGSLNLFEQISFPEKVDSHVTMINTHSSGLLALQENPHNRRFEIWLISLSPKTGTSKLSFTKKSFLGVC